MICYEPPLILEPIIMYIHPQTTTLEATTLKLGEALRSRPKKYD